MDMAYGLQNVNPNGFVVPEDIDYKSFGLSFGNPANGYASFLQYPNLAAVPDTGGVMNITVSMWVMAGSPVFARCQTCVLYQAGCALCFQQFFALSSSTFARPPPVFLITELRLANQSFFGGQGFPSVLNADPTTWTHVAASFSISSSGQGLAVNQAKMYLNGSASLTYSQPLIFSAENAMPADTRTLVFGTPNYAIPPTAPYGSSWFTGFMDKIRVYAAVLSDAQVSSLYQCNALNCLEGGRRSLLETNACSATEQAQCAAPQCAWTCATAKSTPNLSGGAVAGIVIVSVFMAVAASVALIVLLRTLKARQDFRYIVPNNGRKIAL
jgi:hypothetical protein